MWAVFLLSNGTCAPGYNSDVPLEEEGKTVVVQCVFYRIVFSIQRVICLQNVII